MDKKELLSSTIWLEKTLLGVAAVNLWASWAQRTSVGSIKVVNVCFPNCVDKWFQLSHSQMRWCKDNMRKQLVDLLRHMLSKCELHFGCVRLLQRSNKSTCHTVDAFSIRVPPSVFYHEKVQTLSAGNVLFKLLRHCSASNPCNSPSQPEGGALLYFNVLPRC